MSFDVTKIQDGLVGLVGIRQPYDPEYQKIDAANQSSASGLFLDEEIPFFKVKYFVDTQDYIDISDTDLNTKLRDIQRAAISSVCQSVFGTTSYIDRQLVYAHANTRTDVETTIVNGFVGFRIKPSITKNVAFKITQLRLEFQGAGDVNIVLFNSALTAPLFQKNITISSEDQIEDLNWVVNSTNGDYKGEYFLGYEYDGTLVPFKRNYRNSISESIISELCVERVYVEGGNDTTLFDLDQAFGLSGNTGLNPDITTYFDYTDLILQNSFLFSKAVQLQYAISIMRSYISSSRSNEDQRLAKDLILRITESINGSTSRSPIKVIGLNTVLNDEVVKIRQEVADIKEGYFGSGIQVQTLS